MTIDEALQQPGFLIAAWDAAAVGHDWLGIYRAEGAAGEGGVKLLAFERLDAAGRARRTADLTARGTCIGATSGGEYVWAIVDGQRFTAWNLRARLFAATKDDVEVGTTRVPVADVARVTSFLDPRDLGHRGVRVDRASGGAAVLAEEHDPTPEMDPTYNRDNVAIDAAWASALGRELARWLAVAHDDQLP